jgi:hypothetical protein
VARLRLSHLNESYSLFMTNMQTARRREHDPDLWTRCQSIYVAETESFGKNGPAMGGSPSCSGGVAARPSWSPLELRQISCRYRPQLTAGTVSAELDAVRLTLSSGAATTYRLDGPLFPNAPGRRISCSTTAP